MDLTEMEAKHKATADALAEMSAEIERLKAQPAGTLPWPATVEVGMVFEYLGACKNSRLLAGDRNIMTRDNRLVSLSNGNPWNGECGFDGDEKHFRYLGHARDMLKRQRSGQELVGVRCWVPGHDVAKTIVIGVYDAARGYSWGGRSRWFSHAIPADEVTVNGKSR